MKITRRDLLLTAGGTALASSITQAAPKQSPSDKLNLAVVGAGGRGSDDIRDLDITGGVNIVALCDCDHRQAASSFKKYPNATVYTDWRRMFDKEKGIDAVLVATPDHNHAIISVAAMQLGKHVYCEKPLAHSVWEARRMAEVSVQKRVVTQMGTQGHAFEGTRRAVEVIRAGVIGQVRELHVWTDRPAGWWPQGMRRPSKSMPIPDGLDWDVWLGPAAYCDYHSDYLPFKWRGFWDYGTGAIGDMGIHNLDTAYWALELGLPTHVRVKECSPAFSDPAMRDSAPLWTIAELQFPARGSKPAVTMHWYDGGKLPPKDLFQGEPLGSKDGGLLVIGTKGTLFTRTWHGGQTEEDMFVLLPKKKFEGLIPPKLSLPRTKSHHQEFVDACRGKGKTLSPFSYAARLTESLLLANVALQTGKEITWNAKDMNAEGCPEAEATIRPTFREGWNM